jgi:hypothetical protein
MSRLKYLAFLLALALASPAFAVDFDTFVSGRTAAGQPLGSGDKCPLIQGGITKYIACNLLLDTTSSQTPTNKIVNCANNTCTVRANLDVTGVGLPANGFTGLSAGVSGGVLCATSTSVYAFSSAPAANTPMVWGGAGVCPGGGTTSGSGTLFMVGTGTYTNGHGVSINGSGQVVDNANAVFTNNSNTFSQPQTFSAGGRSAQRSTNATSDTLLATDCGNWVYYTATTQVTVTLPATFTPPCSVNVEEASTGRVVFVCATTGCGQGGTSTTPQNTHGFTGTFNQPTATVQVYVDVNSGGTAAHWVLIGDGV